MLNDLFKIKKLSIFADDEKDADNNASCSPYV